VLRGIRFVTAGAEQLNDSDDAKQRPGERSPTSAAKPDLETRRKYTDGAVVPAGYGQFCAPWKMREISTARSVTR
jgi:hypothetical protein